MSYKPYYPNGWLSGETGNTPITPEALNHMENGIATAQTAANEAMPKAGGEMAGAITLNGIYLTEGVDYGTSLPTSAPKGKLFFKKVSG